MNRARKEQGFTAVELLVTLFVAAAFIIASYQLYSFIIRDGSQARAATKVQNLSYDYLRQYSTYATVPCYARSPVSQESTAIEGVVDTEISVDITCPFPDSPDISKVAVTITYNNPQRTEYQATFVNASLNAPSGLVGWWRLNGNTLDAISKTIGTVSGTTFTTSQNGAENGAYRFDGVNDFIELDPVLTDFDNFTISVWMRGIAGVSAADGYAYAVHRSINTTIGSSVYWIGAQSGGNYSGDVSGTVNFNTTTPANTTDWRLITMTYDGATRRTYVDGQLQSTTAKTFTNPTANSRLTLGGTAANSTYRPFQGDMDELRIYERVLPQTEIQSLFDRGAL